MTDSRHYQLTLIHGVAPGTREQVRVEGVYRIEGKGWLWDFSLGDRRILAAAPVLSVAGTDMKRGTVAEDMIKMRGVKVPLPPHVRRIIEPTDELRMLPIKKLLYRRECTLEVKDETVGPPGKELRLATLTTTTDQ
jgi:hypothetical protein